jgi:L-lactate dehydrogenase complex protein LldG
VIPSEKPRTEIIAQFVEYASEYKANVVRTASPELKEVILDLLTGRDSTQVVIPPDFPFENLLEGVDAVKDDGFDGRALDRFDASITCSALGIAETGTVVLDAGPGQGRRALSLVPDHHICIVYEDRIVDSVAEAVAALAESASKGQPLTFISGPSATSDIELTRVEGVHGARKLDIVVTQRVTEVTIA